MVRITLALVRPFEHVPHFILPIFRSFQISYFSTDLLKSFSCSSFNLSVLVRWVQWNLVVDPSHGFSVSYCLSYGPSYFLPGFYHLPFSQPDSFVLPAVMGGTGIVLLSQYTLTHRLQPSLGQSHNLLNKSIINFWYAALASLEGAQ